MQIQRAENKKVLFISESLVQGGSERQMILSCKAIKDGGYQTRFITYSNGDFYYNYCKSLGIQPEICSRKSKIYRLIWIRKIIKSYKPDIIVTLVKAASVYALISSTGIKCDIILTYRSADTTLFDKKYVGLLNIYSKKIKNVVCNSFLNAKIWEEKTQSDKNKIKVIYNVVDYPNCNTEKTLKTEKTEIAIMARVQPVKGARELVEALSILPSEITKKIHITWYGNASSSDDTYLNSVVEFVKEEKLEDIIMFHPAIKNTYGVMRNFDVVALFSRSEGFPNAICEGMVSGKSIIMTEVSDYRELVKDNGIISGKSAEEMKDALVKISAYDFDTLKKMGETSRKIAEGLFDNKKNSMKWNELID